MTRALPIALALAGALVVGCSTAEDRDEAAGAPGLPEGEIHYVAMGDSFTSGPFLDEPRSDPAGCARSTQNYPAFLADWLEVESYTDASCAGATTDNLANPQGILDGSRVRPQLDALSDDTNLVTLGVGANDFVVYGRMIQCRDGSTPCPVEDLRTSAENVEARITVAVEQVRSRAPRAAIHVVGYPQILPPEAGCETVTTAPEVLVQLDGVADALNTSLREGAEAAGASYVDLASPSQGHDVCAVEERWIVDQQGQEGEGAHFHPNLDGMRAAASAVYEAITGEDAPSSDRAEPAEDAVVLNPVG